MDIQLNDVCIKIISMLYKKNCFTEMLSLKREDILKNAEIALSKKTVIKYFKILSDNGYINEGIKYGNCKSYYLTDKGINLILESTKTVANVKKKQSLVN